LAPCSGRGIMASSAGLTEAVLYETLVNYLVSMARTVEGAMNRALDAIVGVSDSRTWSLPGEVFLLEPRINEMEIVIDEHAIRLLRDGSFSEDELRLIVAALKITNDLERIGDQAVNIAQSATRILRHPRVKPYVDLPRMSELAEEMVRNALNAVVRRDVDLATKVLATDDQVDHYRDQIFRELLTYMMGDSSVVFPAFELILVAKNLERIGDHATNIAEDVIYIVQGQDVRHPSVDRR